MFGPVRARVSMRPEMQSLCITYIADEWRKLQSLRLRDIPPIPPPWGVWIRCYAPLVPDWDTINDRRDILQKAWFLDEQGVQERDPWSYARFKVVNSYRPWARGRVTPVSPEALWGKYHQIGMAAFAEIVDEEGVYLETIWGQRHGQGYWMVVGEDGVLEIKRTLWLS